MITAYACILPGYKALQIRDTAPVSASINYQAMTRDETRRFAAETLERIVLSANAPDSRRERAQETLESLLNYALMEAQIESELQARRYGQSVANVSDSFVSVLLEGQPSAADASVILETVSRITGRNMGNIRLIPLEKP